MNKLKSFLLRKWSDILKIIFYPNCKINSQVGFWDYVFPHNILNINKSKKCPWPVHFTSSVTNPDRIKINGINTAPGRTMGCYIQAINGIELGSDIYIAPGVKIISANHDNMELENHIEAKPIKIGNNCWLGANSIILPSVELGNHVIVGAGSVVTKSFSSNSVIAGIPARILKKF